MKATVFHGTRDIRVETVPDPKIKNPTDAIVRVVNAAICGSDLWPYRGISTTWEAGFRIGHEFIGVVEEVGKDTKRVKVGDRVVIPDSGAAAMKTAAKASLSRFLLPMQHCARFPMQLLQIRRNARPHSQ
jgi:threonine dehydrogenase-like Zn-dependent dehydrogenase